MIMRVKAWADMHWYIRGEDWSEEKRKHAENPQRYKQQEVMRGSGERGASKQSCERTKKKKHTHR